MRWFGMALLLVVLGGCADGFGSGVVERVAGVDCSLAAFAANGTACEPPPPPVRPLYCYPTIGQPDCYDRPVLGPGFLEDRLDVANGTVAAAQ